MKNRIRLSLLVALVVTCQACGGRAELSGYESARESSICPVVDTACPGQDGESACELACLGGKWNATEPLCPATGTACPGLDQEQRCNLKCLGGQWLR